MLFNLLVAADSTRSVKVGEASLYALLGFTVVFVGIIFLIFVVWLVGKIIEKTQKKVVKIKKEDVPSQTIASLNEEELSEETIAVIMAALTAYYQTNNPKCEFTLKRIKRI